MSNFPALHIVWDNPSEIPHGGHVPPAMCWVRVSRETDGKWAASLTLLTPKACDWHFSGGAPFGRHNAGVCCLLGPSIVQQQPQELPHRDICFPDPIRRMKLSQGKLLVVELGYSAETFIPMFFNFHKFASWGIKLTWWICFQWN